MGKKKYYIVPVDNIRRSDAYFENKITDISLKMGDNSVSAIFRYYGVPKKYHKIILCSNIIKRVAARISDSVFSKQNNYFASELISDFEFSMVMNLQSEKSHVYLINNPFFDDESKQNVYDYLSLNFELVESSSTDVLIFLKDLMRDGFVTNYIEALSKLFELDKEAVNNINSKKEDFQRGAFQKNLK